MLPMVCSCSLDECSLIGVFFWRVFIFHGFLHQCFPSFVLVLSTGVLLLECFYWNVIVTSVFIFDHFLHQYFPWCVLILSTSVLLKKNVLLGMSLRYVCFPCNVFFPTGIPHELFFLSCTVLCFYSTECSLWSTSPETNLLYIWSESVYVSSAWLLKDVVAVMQVSLRSVPRCLFRKLSDHNSLLGLEVTCNLNF